ncbi:aminotransferase class V-fold PLP-dependent enzyme, partial [Candidatus Peregrinibacteria bacterium]|nr:aminotransferase class V-fold PLP-dependent enzyme [Candidatus Peregrinibacteria bacterium]
MPFDISAIRRQFPILAQKIGENPLVYLDNAATAQKPLAVLEAMDSFYRTSNANVHRGMHA